MIALAPDYDQGSRERVRALGAEPISYSLSRTGIRPLRDVLDIIKLVRQLRRLRPDVFFSYFIKPVVYGGIAARVAGVPQRYAMIEGAGYVFSDFSEGKNWRRSLLKRIVILLYRVGLSGAHRVLFLNKEDVQLFSQERMLHPDKARMIGPIGVDLRYFEYTLPCSDRPVFLMCARLLIEKGVKEFVAAAREVRKIYSHARFVLLGSPDESPASVELSELHDWVKNEVVHWQAHVDDVRPWIARASVCVQPSWYREGVPRGIQEAMAMGRAVITTDMPGCRDAVLDGETGLVVAPRDVGALVNAIVYFITHPEAVISMGVQARRYAERHFDAEKASERMLRALE